MKFLLNIFLIFSSLQAIGEQIYQNKEGRWDKSSSPHLAVEQVFSEERGVLSNGLRAVIAEKLRHFFYGYSSREFVSDNEETVRHVNRAIEKIAKKYRKKLYKYDKILHTGFLDEHPLIQDLKARDKIKFNEALSALFSLPNDQKYYSSNQLSEMLWLLSAKTKKGETFLQLIEQAAFSNSPEDKAFSKHLIKSTRFFLVDLMQDYQEVHYYGSIDVRDSSNQYGEYSSPLRHMLIALGVYTAITAPVIGAIAWKGPDSPTALMDVLTIAFFAPIFTLTMPDLLGEGLGQLVKRAAKRNAERLQNELRCYGAF